MKLRRWLVLCLPWAAGLDAAASAQAPQVDVMAVSEYAAIPPGSTFRVAVRLRLPSGWHIGWTNPGSSGLATTIAWNLPGGVSGGTTEWPYPETDDAGGGVTHVYRGTVVLFSTFAVEPGVVDRVKLSADLNWGICRTVCVQQQRTVTITLPVVPGAARRSTTWAEAEAALRLLPMRERGASFGAFSQGDSVRLAITGLKGGPPPGSWVTFFPLEPGRPSVVAEVCGITRGIAVILPIAVVTRASPERLSGVLVPAHAPGVAPLVRALAVDAAVSK